MHISPNSGSGGDWGDGGSTESLRENFHLHPPLPPGREFCPERKNRFPQILKLGGDGSIFSLICPPQTPDQVGAPASM